MSEGRPFEDAFDGQPDLREVRFELVEAALTAANPTITPGQVELVRDRVAAGLSVRTDDRARWFRQIRVRQLSLVLFAVGVVLLLLGLSVSGPLVGLGAALIVVGAAGSALGRLPARPRLAGVTVTTKKLGSSWADKRLRTAIKAITTVLASRAYAEGHIDAPSVRLSLTDQLADLRRRTAMINILSEEIDALPRADRRELSRGLDEARESVKQRVAVLGRYADQVRQLDAHLGHLNALSAQEQLGPRVDELRARSAADPYHHEEVGRLSVDARSAAQAMREQIERTQRELLTSARAPAVDLAALARRVGSLLPGRRTP